MARTPTFATRFFRSWKISIQGEGVTELLKRTREFLNETLRGDQNLDAKVLRLVEAEYLRQLRPYRRTELALSRQYGMPFEA